MELSTPSTSNESSFWHFLSPQRNICMPSKCPKNAHIYLTCKDEKRAAITLNIKRASRYRNFSSGKTPYLRSLPPILEVPVTSLMFLNLISMQSKEKRSRFFFWGGEHLHYWKQHYEKIFLARKAFPHAAPLKRSKPLQGSLTGWPGLRATANYKPNKFNGSPPPRPPIPVL